MDVLLSAVGRQSGRWLCSWQRIVGIIVSLRRSPHLHRARWAALREGRRRHRDTWHDSASGGLLPGGPRRRVLELCYYRALLRRSSSRVSCLAVGPNDGPFWVLV